MSTQRRSARLLLSLTFAGAIACSGGPPPVTKTEGFARDLAQVVCDWALHCCHNNELSDVLGVPLDSEGKQLLLELRNQPANCTKLMTANLVDSFSAVAAGERAGRISFVELARTECIDQYRNGMKECTIGNAPPVAVKPRPCSLEALTDGTGAAGASCGTDLECQEGLICRRTGAMGVCGPPQAATEACGAGLRCAKDLYCSSLSVSFCTDPGEVGDDLCDDDRDCSATMFCSATTGLCTPKQADGLSCDAHRACASGFCSPESDLCSPPAGAGQPCSQDLECGAGNYCNELAADKDTCIVPAEAGLGARCGATGVRCAAGLACENGICVTGSGPGGWCDSLGANDAYCPDGQYCEDNQCTARKPVGTPCGTSRECVDAAFCNRLMGRCEARATVGQDCTSKECDVSAYCDFAGTMGPRCAARGGNGAACTTAPCQLNLRCARSFGVCAAGVGAGTACHRTGMCGQTAYCGPDPVATSDVCIPALVVGQNEFCDSTSRVCGTGLYCSATGRCAPRLAVGMTCSSFRPDPGCVPGTYCDQFTSQCTAQVAPNGACNNTQPGVCSPGQYCNTGVGACQPFLGVNADCTFVSDGACAPGTFCDRIPSPDICVAAPGVGLPCRFGGNPDQRCAAGLYCETLTSTCRARVAAGAACTSTAQCPVGTHYCDQAMVCLPTKEKGGLCRSVGECNPGLQCASSGVCRPRLPAAAPCTPGATNVCVEDYSCDSASAVCVKLEVDIPTGRPCTFSSQCTSNACVGGLCTAVCVGVP